MAKDSYQQAVDKAATALKTGEDSNWELARLTYENTNRGSHRELGKVSHETWAKDIREKSGRLFSTDRSKDFARMWEHFGAEWSGAGASPSWHDCWEKISPRGDRDASVKHVKEAPAQRKAEILQALLEDPEVAPMAPKLIAEVETKASVEAVAKVRGQDADYIAQHNQSEVTSVRELARNRAERKGTSVKDEAVDAAKFMAIGETADDDREERNAANTGGTTFLKVTGLFSKSEASLIDAAKLVRVVAVTTWDEDEKAILLSEVDEISRICAKIKAHLNGEHIFDWGDEINKILEGVE